MNNGKNNNFTYTYSSDRQEEIQRIRNKYAEPEEDKLEQLRRLDAKVTGKATTVALIVGVIGALIMGLGMSLCMSALGDALGSFALPIGIGLGTVGIAILACAYPLYNRTLKKERAKFAPQILKLTDELMK